MNIEKLKEKLCKYGHPFIVKQGVVFTVLIKGLNLSKWENVTEIQKLVLEYAGEKYPTIEAMVNDNEVFCLVLRPPKEEFELQKKMFNDYFDWHQKQGFVTHKKDDFLEFLGSYNHLV